MKEFFWGRVLRSAMVLPICLACACAGSGQKNGDSGTDDGDGPADGGDPGQDAGSDAGGDENPDAGDGGGDGGGQGECPFPYSPLEEHVLELPPPIGGEITAYDIHQLCTLDWQDVRALAFVKAEPIAATGFGDVSYEARAGYLCRDGRVEALAAGAFEFSMAHHGWTSMRVAFDGYQYVYDWSEMCIGARPCTSNPDVMKVLRLSDGAVMAEGLAVTCVYTTAAGIPLPLTHQVRVPAAGMEATFQMGSTAGDADEQPVHEVIQLPVRMDVREATNADFALFLNDQGNDCQGHLCLAEGVAGVRLRRVGGVWRPDPGTEALPVVQVTWHGADAYCKWRSWMQLPTEAQWEMAASAAGTRDYPWGDSPPDCNRAVFAACASGGPLAGCNLPSGNSPEGICDLAGNVSEWIADWYQADYYSTCAAPCDNPQGPDADTGARVVRGGSFASHPATLRAADRDSAAPDSAAADRGFRCVRWTMPI